MRPKIKITILLLTLGVLFVSSAVITINFSCNLISIDDTIEVDDENIGVDEDNSEVNDNINLKSPKTSGYWGPSEVSFIHINNNWTDARDNLPWVQGGDGSWGNPFFIENVTIDAGSSPTGYGILIQNSDVYFKIKNCTVYNAIGDPYAGICLTNINNSRIIDNKVNNNWFGMRIMDSNNNTISGNDASNNNDKGIFLHYSHDNIIFGNYVNNNQHGISLQNGHYNIISGNEVNDNDGGGIYLQHGHYNIISGNDLNDNDDAPGIDLERSNDNTITRNDVNDNDNGIALDNSDDNTISENQVKDNDGDGIWLEDSNDNTILENEVKGNDDNGIRLKDSDDNTILENEVTGNGAYGIWLEDSDNNEVKRNDLRGNNDGCIIEINCEGNVIKDNKCDDIDVIITITYVIIIFIIIMIVLFSLLNYATKSKPKKELEEIKTELENRFPEIENLIQTKDFSKATNELETVRSIAKQHKFVEIVKWAEKILDLCANLKKITKKDIQNRLRMVTNLIQKEQFLQAINELNNIIEEAKLKNFDGIIKQANDKLRICQELEEIKTELENRFPAIENLIQTKDFSKATNELETVRSIAKQHKFVEIVKWAEKNLDLCANLKKITKKDIQNRLRMVKDLIREEQFSVAIKELNNIVEEAKFKNFDGIVKQADKKLRICQELEKIKADLERSFPTIENLIQTKDFSKAINELKNVRSIAKKRNFAKIIRWAEKNLDLCKNLIIKKTVLELGSKFGRIQTIEISEKTGIKDEELIINLIQEMIENKEIYAEYFSSTKSILFNQQVNIDEIDKLMGAFKEWEDKKVGKKD